MNTESLNRLLYGSKLLAYAIMRRTTYVLTIVSVGLLLYAHGVVQDPAHLQAIFYSIDAILAVFVLIYLRLAGPGRQQCAPSRKPRNVAGTATASRRSSSASCAG